MLIPGDVPGEKRPSRVRADVTVNLSVRNEIKAEWENLRKHDVCFLITVRPTSPIGKTQSAELDPESKLALYLSMNVVY